MDNNVIYLSDASYDPRTNEVGIGIKNLYTGLSHAVFTHASSALEAEEFALLEAIEHALHNNHRNCVFVYDNINIDTRSIGQFYSKMFEKIQFMWFKRDYLHVVDRLASNIRLKHTISPHWSKVILSYASQISDEELICVLMPLTRGETYGYLCALSGIAPMMKPFPNHLKEVNEKVIALLLYVGSQSLYVKLSERFKKVKCYKQKFYDELLRGADFDMSWFSDAAKECSQRGAA
jgi:hypothetical protein